MSRRIRLVWYTDPHNVWCWGCEPIMRRLQAVYPDAVDIEVRMGGLFEDFTPVREQWARMSGGRWTESVAAFFDAVSGQHRMPMATPRMIQAVEDFRSTWPACVAAKAAALQGPEEGWRYLRRLREAWCLDGRAIHRIDVQREVAREAGIDVDGFTAAVEDGRADDAFRGDREECVRIEVTGFPTFAIERGEMSARLNGWQPWEIFEDLVRRVDPEIQGRTVEPTEASVADLLRQHGRWATREIAAVLGVPDDDAEILLEELEGAGRVVRHLIGNGIMWQWHESLPAE